MVFSLSQLHGLGEWLTAGQPGTGLENLCHCKLFYFSQKKHKPIMRHWSRMKLSPRKTGIQGPGTSADLSLQSTITLGISARMANSRCWCAWEPGTAVLGPWVCSSKPRSWCHRSHVKHGQARGSSLMQGSSWRSSGGIHLLHVAFMYVWATVRVDMRVWLSLGKSEPHLDGGRIRIDPPGNFEVKFV